MVDMHSSSPALNSRILMPSTLKPLRVLFGNQCSVYPLAGLTVAYFLPQLDATEVYVEKSTIGYEMFRPNIINSFPLSVLDVDGIQDNFASSFTFRPVIINILHSQTSNYRNAF
ncbi:hypothetical protein TNCV_4005411 [Trichonephila clavipes]|nr:hypothetical protein TNCV_4005411 [Trichonephila clavipes]